MPILDTELYMDQTKQPSRWILFDAELLSRFKCYIEQLDANAETTRVNEIRRSIEPSGTNGQEEPEYFPFRYLPAGKTLSSLALHFTMPSSTT